MVRFIRDVMFLFGLLVSWSARIAGSLDARSKRGFHVSRGHEFIHKNGRPVVSNKKVRKIHGF